MSPEAAQFLRDLAAEYVKDNFPHHRRWNFKTAAAAEVRKELRAMGLLRVEQEGAPWLVTDAGQQWLMENLP